MTPEQKQLLDKRKEDFPAFYEQLIPSLVDFVGKMGISPAHEVLKMHQCLCHFCRRSCRTWTL
jgi:hypothetical protein